MCGNRGNKRRERVKLPQVGPRYRPGLIRSNVILPGKSTGLYKPNHRYYYNNYFYYHYYYYYIRTSLRSGIAAPTLSNTNDGIHHNNNKYVRHQCIQNRNTLAYYSILFIQHNTICTIRDDAKEKKETQFEL